MNTIQSTITKVDNFTTAIIGTIVSLVFVIIGFYLLFNSDNQENLVDVVGKINKVSCYPIYSKNSINYNCNSDVAYNVNNKEYVANIMTNTVVPYYVGNPITVTYDKTNPENATNYQVRNKTMSYILIGIGSAVISIVWINFYMNKSQ